MTKIAPPPTADVSAEPSDHDQAVANEALRMAFNDVDPLVTPPVVAKKETPPPVIEKKEEPPVVEEKKEAPPVEEKPEPASSDNLDAPPEGVVLPKPTSKDLRSQLEQRNKLFAQLEGEKKLAEEELANLRKEVEELRTKTSKESEAVEKMDYREAPEVKKHTTQIQQDVDAVGRVIGGAEGKKLRSSFYTEYLPEFVRAAKTEGIAGDELMDALRSKLDTDLSEGGARDAMALLGRSLPTYDQALSELKRLEGDSHNHRTRQSVDKYLATEKELSGVLDPLGELPEEAVIAKPHAPEAFVSKLLASDPKWLARSQQVKKEIREIFAGPKPLTPEERASMTANDAGGLSQVEETRQKQHAEKRTASMKRLYLAMMILPNFPTLSEELESLRAGKISEDSELDALANVPAASPPPAKKKDEDDVPDLKEAMRDIFRKG